MLCGIVMLCSAFAAFVFLATLLLRIPFYCYDVRTTFKWFCGKYHRESIGAALSGSHTHAHRHQTYGLACMCVRVHACLRITFIAIVLSIKPIVQRSARGRDKCTYTRTHKQTHVCTQDYLNSCVFVCFHSAVFHFVGLDV